MFNMSFDLKFPLWLRTTPNNRPSCRWGQQCSLRGLLLIHSHNRHNKLTLSYTRGFIRPYNFHKPVLHFIKTVIHFTQFSSYKDSFCDVFFLVYLSMRKALFQLNSTVELKKIFLIESRPFYRIYYEIN